MRCLLSEAGAAAAGSGRALYPCDSSSRCSADRDFGSKTVAEGRGVIEESQFLLQCGMSELVFVCSCLHSLMSLVNNPQSQRTVSTVGKVEMNLANCLTTQKIETIDHMFHIYCIIYLMI